tara:strand:- start:1130 stop:2974 length:1845 start_codon:yes stop_codon:yes gene_type:complete
MFEISNLDKENRAFRLLKIRSRFLFILITLLGGVTLFQIIKLTVIDANLYSTKSDDNRIIRLPIYSSRGLIRLHDGEIIVENVVSQALTIIPDKTVNLELTLKELKEELYLREEELQSFNKRLKKNSSVYETLVIAENLTQEQIAKYTVEKERWPSTSIKAQLLRFNVLGSLFSHVIGHLGPISIEEQEDSEKFLYPLSYWIGKTGVEEFYEEFLRGGIGYKTIEVDAHGKEFRELERTIPEKANNLYLSLNKNLQSLAREELAGRKGAVVALDPNNGLIKALVSSPDFNPNILNKTETGNVISILNDEQSPLFNRAIAGIYPPASIIKPFIGLLGLKEGVIRWDSTIEDPGFFQIEGEGRKYRGWKEEGHGTVDLKKSIIESSDVFFYQLATQLKVERISEFLKQFGFGLKTGIDLFSETEGILPDRKWKLGTIGEPWFIGDTINMGIGQGYINCTPLQLAVAVSLIATKGIAYKPRIVEKIGDELTQKEIIYEIKFIEDIDWQKLQDSMGAVISAWNGTAHNLTQLGKNKIAGKTGTAQIKSLTDEELTVKEEYEDVRLEESNRDHALFVGYGPLIEPKLTVVVIVENGESGSAIAAPIAQRLIDYYLESKR